MQEGKPADPQWLRWTRELQAIAQNGLHFTRDPYDRQRYEALREIAAQMMAAGSDHPLEAITGLFSSQAGYATPKVDVRGVVFRDGRILLVRESQDGLWTLPGGWADPNESPAESVTREIQEEAGFATRAVKLLAVYDREKQGQIPPFAFHVYKLFILCGIESGEPTPSIETLEVAFFPEDALPPLSTTRVTQSQIARCFEHFRHPGWPADFD
ncbi:MAG TPA: NUDIX hydrolase [Chthoniobacteraceae bacterium]|jgi:ADP-ribose pyrophosphatase YjhB (NUDIX family)|nr:NUDIX hydrolase [Chthoniobacteraceae bacterium]